MRIPRITYHAIGWGGGGGVHDHVTPDVSCEKGTGKNSAQVVYLEVHGRLNG